jgi:hypothetical protein
MWIGDVGQGVYEEIDFRAAGNQRSNFGWRCYEGNIPTPGIACTVLSDTINPVYQYDHGSSGGRAVTGGIVYRGNGYPYLKGWYSAIDFYTGNSWLIKADRSQPAYLQSGLPDGIAAFGEDEARELFSVSLTTGQVYQVQALGIVPVKLSVFNAVEKDAQHIIYWKTDMEENMDRFDLHFSTDGRNFKTIYSTKAGNRPQGTSYSFKQSATDDADIFFRLAMVDNDGTVTFSRTVHFKGSAASVLVVPTLVKNNTITIQSNKAYESAVLIDMNGRTRMMRNQRLMPGVNVITLPELSSGIYILRLSNGNEHVNRSVMID